ncbi:MAG: O-antigen ligase family protein [Coriobacteriia bacterium]|nr:O-antigen ligase family protein [Coriobacteriia bacterium]
MARQRTGLVCAAGAWWCLLAIVVLVPFVHTNTSLGSGVASQLTYDAVVLPKLSLIAILAGLGLALHVVSMVAGMAELRRPRIMLIVALLLGWVCLATATSVSPSLSIIGETLSGEGLAAYAAYVLVFTLTVQQVTSVARARTVATFAVATGSVIACYALLQLLRLDPLTWPDSGFGARIFATFGNPDLLASYLVFPFALSIGLLLSEESPTPRFWLASLGLLTTSSCLVVGLARGAWIAAPVAVAVVALAAWRNRSGLLRSQWWVLAAFALTLLAVAASLLGPKEGLSSAQRATAVLGRTAGASFGDRIEIWRAALVGVSRRSLVGWGPDTFKYVYHSAAGGLTWRVGGHASYADNAHDIILQVAATLGIPGLLLYGAAVVAPLTETAAAVFGAGADGSRTLFGADDARSRILVAGAWASVIALVTVLLFEPATPVVVVWLWLSLGILASAQARTAPIDSNLARAAGIAVSVLLVAFSCWGASWFYADVYARRALDSATLPEAESNLSSARAINPLAQQYYILSGQRNDELLWSAVNANAPHEEIAALADASVSAYSRAVNHDPQDPIAASRYVHALNQEQLLAPAPATAALALVVAQSAEDRWPNVPDVVLELARAQFQAGQLAPAENSAIRAATLDPGFEYAWLTIGQVRIARGDRAGATTALTTAVKLDPSDSEAVSTLSSIGEPDAGQSGSSPATVGVQP